MDYERCPLYQMKSKKRLFHFLGIKDKDFLKDDYVSKCYTPYVEKKIKNGKMKLRLIEPPRDDLKAIQNRIKKALHLIPVPPYVFSGIKNRSYAQNALFHIGNKCVVKLDLTAFFPSVAREKVYRFFLDDLETSPDIAALLTNFTTVNIDKSATRAIDDVNEFFTEKKVKTRSHLVSGAPTSQTLSYFVNHHMFDEIHEYASSHNTVMTIYVDDVTFSSDAPITRGFINHVEKIVNKYGYRLSSGKLVRYSRCYPKIITGVAIAKDGKPRVKNSLRKKIMDALRQVKTAPNSQDTIDRLRGLVTAAQQVEPRIFMQVRKFAYSLHMPPDCD